MSRTQTFLAAKQIIRLHPERSDEEIAEELGITKRDVASVATIAQARKDLAAGDTDHPHLR